MIVPEPPSLERLKYDDLREEVSQFVNDFKLDQSIPVDVEKIADTKLRLDIVPVPRLRLDRGLDGFLSSDRRSIYVQDTSGEGRLLNRHRFTLAEELGHWYLHEDLYRAAQGLGLAEVSAYINSLQDEDIARFEWQAKCFAGLLLVPSEDLAKAIQGAIAFAAKRGFSKVDLADESHRGYLARHIGDQFGVSDVVVLKRGAYDKRWANPA